MHSTRLVRKVKSTIILSDCTADNRIRCTARANNFDNDSRVVLRSREHTNTFVRMLELSTLWDEYSLVGDVVVRIVLFMLSCILWLILSAIH
jgi:hypothetical protein